MKGEDEKGGILPGGAASGTVACAHSSQVEIVLAVFKSYTYTQLQTHLGYEMPNNMRMDIFLHRGQGASATLLDTSCIPITSLARFMDWECSAIQQLSQP